MLKDGVNLQSMCDVLVRKLRHQGDALPASQLFAVLKNLAPHCDVAPNHTCRLCGDDRSGGNVSQYLTTLPVSHVLQAIQALQSH